MCLSLQVEKLVLIDASVYAKGTGNLAKLPRALAYAGVSVLSLLIISTSSCYLDCYFLLDQTIQNPLPPNEDTASQQQF